MQKDRTQKTTDEMTFNEFKTWAAGYILFGIGEGASLQSLVHTIINATARNKVFGGDKPKDLWYAEASGVLTYS